MGQVATLGRFKKTELEKIKADKVVNWDDALESVYVDKFWEHIMYVFGNGNGMKPPFEYIFMPTNRIYITEEREPWSESIKFHSFENIVEMNSKMSEVTRELVIERIDIEKMNSKGMYQIMSEDTVPYLINHVMDVKKFFEDTKEDEIIIGDIG